MEKEIPKDRNGTSLSYGDLVNVFLDHKKRPFPAKVICPGIEKSIIRKEGGRYSEPIDNQNLEVF